MPKSFLIDATHFGAAKPTGVERYADMLLPFLADALIQEGASVTWVGHGEKPAGVPDKVSWLVSPHVKGWGQRAIGHLMKDFTAYFTPSGNVPITGDYDKFMTVHDLSFEKYPDAYSFLQRFRLHSIGKRAAKSCKAVIVGAEAVKQDLQNLWHIQPEKVHVIPHGTIPLSTSEEVIPKVGERYIFFVGRIETKKNLLPLIQAFSVIAKEDAEIQLVLAGGGGVGEEKVRSAVENLEPAIKKRVLLPGYISEEQQAWGYRHARVIAVPSPAEGFGFPILQGFEASVPVITVTEGAAPEVGADGVYNVSATSNEEWVAGLREVAFNEGVRETLIEEGKKRLQSFSWEKSAAETARVLLMR